jgi:two-component system CheB/CheR fusion protein
MSIHKIEGISHYVTFLNDNPKEIEILFKELLIGVTNFFRDEEVWTLLKETIIPDLISRLEPGSILRAWVPGCSTGEEAYSLAILFKEVVEKINPHGGFSLQIFATDLDNDAIEIARKGIFPSSIAADVSPERLKRYFLRTDDGYFIKTEIREKVVFAHHNIIMHPPFTKIDILTCRNLLIYMDPELQKKMIGLFYYSMNPGGVMVLGLAETLGIQSHLFESLDTKWKIFKRANTSTTPGLYGFPSALAPASAKNEIKPPLSRPNNIQTVADKMLLQTYLPAGVLVNENGDIIYISGHTGKYLEPAVGKANMNIFAMLREGLRKEFPVAFRKVVMNKEPVNLHNLKVGTNGSSVLFNVSIHYISDSGLLNGMLFIIFTDIHDLPDKDVPELLGKNLNQVRKRELEKELRDVYAKNYDALEAMRNSQEQFKSTNEELQAANEELQSANEELVSSKEEMQSLNEELQTLNAELQSKVEEFTHVNNDMKNLLDSTDIATLFLDKELKIRRFTIQTVKIFKMIKSDIGRPFTDLDSDLVYPEISVDVMTVLKTLTFIKKQIPTRDGHWYSVRIMPYRTFDDHIDGVVITFFNISDLKKVEFKLYETEQTNNLLMKGSSEIIIKLSADLKILEINPAAENYFGKSLADVLSKNFVHTFVPEPLRKRTEKEMKKILNNSLENNIKMMLITAEGQIEADILLLILLNNVKVPSGMILSIKK